MLQDTKGREVLKKSYEISYALSRVGSHSAEPSLKDVLLRQAFSLLEAAAIADYAKANLTSIAIEYLVQFGNDIGLIHKDNAATLIFQIAGLKELVAAPGESVALSAIPFDDIFSTQASRAAEGPQVSQAPQVVHREKEIDANAAIRQSAILERIRQSGNCRLKDIQEILPELSERTIRYDLQSLLERNLIERIGNGGPSVYYKVR